MGDDHYNINLGTKAEIYMNAINQVEATTEKRGMVISGNGLFSRVTQCTGITAPPVLTGICTYYLETHIFFYRVR